MHQSFLLLPFKSVYTESILDLIIMVERLKVYFQQTLNYCHYEITYF